jgi:hypothetical protein
MLRFAIDAPPSKDPTRIRLAISRHVIPHRTNHSFRQGALKSSHPDHKPIGLSKIPPQDSCQNGRLAGTDPADAGKSSPSNCSKPFADSHLRKYMGRLFFSGTSFATQDPAGMGPTKTREINHLVVDELGSIRTRVKVYDSVSKHLSGFRSFGERSIDNGSR